MCLIRKIKYSYSYSTRRGKRGWLTVAAPVAGLYRAEMGARSWFRVPVLHARSQVSGSLRIWARGITIFLQECGLQKIINANFLFLWSRAVTPDPGRTKISNKNRKNARKLVTKMRVCSIFKVNLQKVHCFLLLSNLLYFYNYRKLFTRLFFTKCCIRICIIKAAGSGSA